MIKLIQSSENHSFDISFPFCNQCMLVGGGGMSLIVVDPGWVIPRVSAPPTGQENVNILIKY